LDVREVVKSYGPRKALKGVSLAVQPGEFVALLGPNGAGKSTLFQLLSGLFTADSGQIRVCGQDMADSPIPALAQLGVVFQQATLDLDLTVAANLRFHARLHGIGGKQARERIDTELTRLGLIERAGDSCRALSGGNRRKVELARALLHTPGVLLMDEATVGLDPESRQSLLTYVRELCQTRNMAVLWATHLVDEAADADHVFVLEQGQLLASGTPADIQQNQGCASLLEAFLQLTGRGDAAALSGGKNA
jgi:ABC-2 type transport system ATP-binding protein